MLYVGLCLSPNGIDLSVIASLVESKTSIYNWKYIRNIHSSVVYQSRMCKINDEALV